MKSVCRFLKSKRILGAASALAVTFAATANAEEEKTRNFSIEAQPLVMALVEFSRQSDITVIAPSKTTRGRQSRAVVGEMEPAEALEALLGEADLELRTRRDRAIILAQVSEESAPIRETQIEDDAGSFAVSEDEGDVFQQLEEIIVTGTNIRGVENPTTPVIQFDKEDIELSGAGTVEDFLRTIPQNFSSLDSAVSGQTGDPFNGVVQNSTNGTALNLRGVGLGATLTLLNGRRLPNASGFSGSFVDVSFLPVGVIERVDVQTDGASAVYGSDAVGGVVNFITAKDYDGAQVSTRYGLAHGGGEELQANVTGGKTWRSGGALVNLNYGDRNPLTNSDRDFIDLGVAGRETSLINEEERFGSYISTSQQITDRLDVAADFIYSYRESVNTGSRFGVIETNQSEVKTLVVNGRLSYQATDDVSLSVFVDYADEASEFQSISDPDANYAETTSDLLSIEGNVSGAVLSLPAGKVSFAFGGSFREENRERRLADGTFFDPLSADRSVSAAYGELLIPLVSNDQGVQFINQLNLSIAGRYEDYSDFGETINPKIGLHWQPTETLTFRSTYSESFRAPPLANTVPALDSVSTIAVPASFLPGASDLPQDSRLPDGFVSFLSFSGASSLTEETAKIWSGGAVYSPEWLDGFQIEVNYFDVSYTDRIENIPLASIILDPAFSDLYSIDPDDSLLEPLFLQRDQLGGSFNNFLPFDPEPSDIQVAAGPSITNISSRDVSGLDILASYDFETAIGSFTTSLNASKIFEYTAQLTPSSISSDQVGTLYRPPALSLRGDVTYSRGGFTAFAAINYVDDYQDVVESDSAVSIDAWTTVDLTIAYSTGSNASGGLLNDVRAAVSVTNLFDEEPPFVATSLDGLNFDTANANAIGRYISLNLTKRF